VHGKQVKIYAREDRRTNQIALHDTHLSAAQKTDAPLE
jgi:hypothetical protein